MLARAAINDEVADVLCRRQVWADVEGIHDISFGPMAKMFTTETMYRDASAIVEAGAATFSFQVGANSGQEIALSIGGVDSSKLGVNRVATASGTASMMNVMSATPVTP